MLPRGQKSARTERRLEGRRKITNGTAGQMQAFGEANPVGSVGFRELLVRTAGRETVRKNRGDAAHGKVARKGFRVQTPALSGDGGSDRIKRLVLRHSEQKSRPI